MARSYGSHVALPIEQAWGHVEIVRSMRPGGTAHDRQSTQRGLYEEALLPTSFAGPEKERAMADFKRARVVGFNHVALEVGDIEEALAFYGRLFEFELRGKSATMAFIDLGDQFIALQKGRKQPPDDGRHFGLVVDDKEAARRALKAAGVKVLPGRFLDFLDPWGNRIEIVGYDNIQFTKAPNVLRGMGLTRLAKNESAKKELAAKGMGVE
jgi:lactoylglutathione lyase